MLRYTVTPNASAHLFECSLCLIPGSDTLKLRMPVWTSGSYLVRDYAGRLRSVESNCGHLTQTDSAVWILSGLTPGKAVCIDWQVFAFSQGIHDAYIDHRRGFFNPASVLLLPEDSDDEACELHLNCRPGMQTFCSLPASAPDLYTAANLQTLLDAPVTLVPDPAPHCVLDLSVRGIPHRVLFTGTDKLHLAKLSADITAIIDTVLTFWGSAPFNSYLFHVQLGPGLFGGLEHENSCVLQKDATHLPGPGATNDPADYDDFLRLLAHEYFHAWLVKFLRPSVLLPYKLSAPVHTRELWVFEGFTSYYETLLPLRAGLLNSEDALKLLSKRFNAVREQEGFEREALSDASFNAWTHLYKRTADSPYSQSSYYGKGAVLAFMLDAALRENANSSLDSVLRRWYEEALLNPSLRGLPENGFPALMDHLSGGNFSKEVEALTLTADSETWNRAWTSALRVFGLKENCCDVPAARRYAGLSLRRSGSHHVVGYTPTKSPAYQAGLFDGDELIAVDGVRTDAAVLDRQIEAARGQTVSVHYFRENTLCSAMLAVSAEPLPIPGQLSADNLTPIGRDWLSWPNQQV